MKINEVIQKDGFSKCDYHWDEERVGFATTVNGEEIQFFPAKSRWDRSAANDAAKKLAVLTHSKEIAADQAKREHEHQYVKPLSALELEWVELMNRFMTLDEKELRRWTNLSQVCRKSLLDRTHPSVK